MAILKASLQLAAAMMAFVEAIAGICRNKACQPVLLPSHVKKRTMFFTTP